MGCINSKVKLLHSVISSALFAPVVLGMLSSEVGATDASVVSLSADVLGKQQAAFKQVTIYKQDDSVYDSYITDVKFIHEGDFGHNISFQQPYAGFGYGKSVIDFPVSDECVVVRLKRNLSTILPSIDGQCLSEGTYTYDEVSNTFVEGRPDVPQKVNIYLNFEKLKDISDAVPAGLPREMCMFYRGLPANADANWNTIPVQMTEIEPNVHKAELDIASSKTGIEFYFTDCLNLEYKKPSNDGARDSNFIIAKINDAVNYTVDFTDSRNTYDNVSYIKEFRAKPALGDYMAPVVVLQPEAYVKAGEVFELDASASRSAYDEEVKFNWSTNEQTPTILVSPTADTTYSLYVVDKNDVYAESDVLVHVLEPNKEGGNKPPKAVAQAMVIHGFPSHHNELDGSKSYDPDGKIISYEWKDDQGNIWGNSPKVVGMFRDSSTRYYLTVTDNEGAKDTAFIDVKLVSAKLKTSVNGLEANLNADIIDAIPGYDMSGFYYQWDFGDGTTYIGNDKNVTHVYDKAGTYKVHFAASSCPFDDGYTGCASFDTVADVVVGTTSDKTVQAKISNSTNDQPVATGTMVTLDASSSVNADKYVWSDGFVGAVRNVKATAQDDLYCVTVTGVNGNTDIACTTVQGRATGDETLPIFYKDVSSNRIGNKVELGQSIILDASSVTPYIEERFLLQDKEQGKFLQELLDSCKFDYAYKWETGETASMITVYPTSSKSYNVNVTSTVSQELLDKNEYKECAQFEVSNLQKNINIAVIEPQKDEPPIAKITPSNVEITTNSFVTFDAALSTDDKGIVAYKWVVDGVKQDTTDTKLKLSFNAVGQHVVELTLMDKIGQTATATAMVNVVSSQEATGATTVNNTIYPIVNFDFKGDPFVFKGSEVRFNAQNTKYQGEQAAFAWSVNGNVQSTNSSALIYPFNITGMNLVSLVVTDTEGRQGVMTREIPVVVMADEEFVDTFTGELKKATPKFRITFSDLYDKVKVVNSAEVLSAKTTVNLDLSSVLKIVPENYVGDVLYYVYKVPTTGLTSLDEPEGILCYFNNDSTVNCDDDEEVVKEHVKLDASRAFELNLPSIGEYEVRIIGTDRETSIMSVANVKVSVSEIGDVEDQGDEGENELANGGSATSISQSDSTSSSSGGGAFDFNSLLLLVLAAFIMRKKQLVATK